MWLRCRVAVSWPANGTVATLVHLRDTNYEMRCALIVIVVLMVFSLVAAPLAMALDGCSGMGTACDAVCSAPCASVSAPTSSLTLASVGTPAPAARPRISATALKTLDTPPKSPLSA